MGLKHIKMNGNPDEVDMETGSHGQCFPRLRFLEDSQIKRIHGAVLRILKEVGVRVHHDEAIELLVSNGARVQEKNHVFIPEFLVEEAIRSAPSSLVIFNRLGEPVMDLGGRRIYFGTGTDLPKTIDLKTREIRHTKADDVIAAALIGDAMPQIDFIGSYGLPRDIQPGLHYIRCFQLQVENSTKPIFFTAESEEDLRVIREMAAAAVGGKENLYTRPFLIHYSEPTSPLVHSREAVAKLIYCARTGIPVNYTPALLAGSTGPVTLAGSLCVAAAEALSGLVIHQSALKGAPIITGVAATTMDMLHATVSYTSPEFRLTHSAYADLFHHYGLPIWGTAGCSDAQFPDLQAGAEYAFTLLNAALDGANLIHDCGYMGQGFIGAPEMILFANELIGMVKRYLKGFEINETHLALDVIKSVGPGGHFLGEKHTLDFFKKEHWRPEFFNRENLSNWLKNGKKTTDEKLIARALEILETHRPKPLPPEAEARIGDIWRAALEKKRS